MLRQRPFWSTDNFHAIFIMHKGRILGIQETLDLCDWQSDCNLVASWRILQLRSLDAVFMQPPVD